MNSDRLVMIGPEPLSSHYVGLRGFEERALKHLDASAIELSRRQQDSEQKFVEALEFLRRSSNLLLTRRKTWSREDSIVLVR